MQPPCSAWRSRTGGRRGAGGVHAVLAVLLTGTVLLGSLQPCHAVRPPDMVARRQLRGSTTTNVTSALAAAAPSDLGPVNPNLTVAAPDNSLPVNSVASLITQQPPEPPPPRPAPAGSASSRLAAAPAPAPSTTGLSAMVGTVAQLAEALLNDTVSDIQLLGNITLSSMAWVPGGTVQLTHDVTIAPAPNVTQQPTLDFGRLAYAIVVQPYGQIAFDNITVQGIASAAAGVAPPSSLQSSLQANDTYRVVGLPIWPSLGGSPNSTVVINSSTVFYHDTDGYVNCTLFQERQAFQYAQIYGPQDVSTPGDTVYVSGRHVIRLPLLPNSGGNISTGDVLLDTTDLTAACQLSSGQPFLGPPRRAHFPAWAGVLIGIGVAILAFTILVAVLLLRRRRHSLHDRAEAQEKAMRESQQGSDGSKLSSTGGTFRHANGQEGTSDDFLATLWPGRSRDLSSKDSEEVLSLGQYHKQLLAMRAGSGLEGIEVGPILGRGSYGRVYKGRWNGALVAIKVIDATPSEDAADNADSARESILAASVSHPNVIATYKICTVRMGDTSSAESGDVEVPPEVVGMPPDSNGIAGVPVTEVPPEDVSEQPQGLLETWMLLEYADRGSLEQAIQQKRFLRKPDQHLDMASVYKSLVDVATGMQYLHGLGIVHGDLKPANVLLKSTVSDTRGFACKLADFGLSRILDLNSTHVSTQSVGTVPYMPPELLSTGRMSKAVDAYSFGILMWELFTGAMPYKGMAFGQVMYGVVHSSLRPDVPDGCPSAYVDLMQRCWADDPAVRPDFGDVAAALKEQAKEVTAAAKAAAAAAAAAQQQQKQQQPARAGSASPVSPTIAAVTLDVEAGLPEAAAGKQEAAEAARAEKRERSLHESLRDLRRAITSGRSFSFRPRSASGSVAASPESASRPAGQPSPAAVAAMRAGPGRRSIHGEWVPDAARAHSVSGLPSEAAAHQAAISGAHHRSASVSAGPGGFGPASPHERCGSLASSGLRSIASGLPADFGSGGSGRLSSISSRSGSGAFNPAQRSGGGADEPPRGSAKPESAAPGSAAGATPGSAGVAARAAATPAAPAAEATHALQTPQQPPQSQQQPGLSAGPPQLMRKSTGSAAGLGRSAQPPGWPAASPAD